MKYLAILLLSIAAFGQTIKGPVALKGRVAQSRGWNIALSWQASTTQDVTSYNVYRGTVSGGPYQKIGSSTTLNYSDPTVGKSFSFFYVVTAVDPSGESVNSNEVSVTK